MSHAYSTAESRRAPREAVDCQTHIHPARHSPAEALIVNISPYGCMLRCDCSVPIGATLTVELPRVGKVGGIVIWSLGARLGIEFASGIALDDYLAMLPLMRASFDGMPLG